jgi:aldoxime dehydratase
MMKRNRDNMPAGFEPPVPAWAADWSDSTQSLTSAFYAVQGDLNQPFAQWATSALFAVKFAPERVESAKFTDREGIVNHVYIAYWRDQNYQNWWAQTEVANWWHSDERLDEGVGYWR